MKGPDKKMIINSCINNLRKKNFLTVSTLKSQLAINGIFLSNQEIQALLDTCVSNGTLKFDGKRYN